LHEIKEYEAECVRDMEATKSEVEASLEQAKQLLQSIRKVHDTERYLSELTQQTDDRLNKLKLLLFELQGYQFGGRLLRFNERSRCCQKNEEARAYLVESRGRVEIIKYNNFYE
jgi:hypothetical protein